MIRCLTIVAVLVLLGLLAVQPGMAQDFRPWSSGSPTDIENFVREIFLTAQSSGSMTLSGTCMDTERATNQVVSDTLPHPPEGPFHNIDEALTALSRLDPHLSWARDVKGVLRIRDDRVPDDVLRIRLKRVHFAGKATPGEAIWQVLSAPEVRAYFKEMRIEDGLMFNTLEPASKKGLPKLSGDLRDVSVAEAFDYIARFFPGLWIYKECRDGSFRRVLVRPVQVR
jgi:hypothetical protein